MTTTIDVKYTPQISVSSDAIAWLAHHDAERWLLERFIGRMVEELAANEDKGNRAGWLTMNRKDAVGEIGWHWAKLAVAAKEFETDRECGNDVLASESADRVLEHIADVANCALMVGDVLGLLDGRGRA